MAEVHEQLLAAFDRIYGRTTPDEVLRQIDAATLGHAQPDLTPGLERPEDPPAPAAASHGETLPCPFSHV